jgi:ParB family transcriptional regulator, chromosome partitioning protein
MKQARRLGTDPAAAPSPAATSQPSHIQGIRVGEVPQPNLSRSVSDILAARGQQQEPSPSPVHANPESEPPAHLSGSESNNNFTEVTLLPSAGPVFLKVGLIDPSPYQPRIIFSPEALSLLADTMVDSKGVNNPIIVRRKANGRYEVIAGERRLRAAKLLRHVEIYCMVRELSDADAAILATTDNDAREDLSDFERGRSYKRLMDEGMVASQQELSRRVGRSLSTVSRCLSYFKLPTTIIDMLVADPMLIGNKVVGEFVSFTETGHRDLVIKAVEKIRDAQPRLSQESALNWLKGEVRRSSNPMAPLPPRTLNMSGRTVADVKVEGRKVVLTCPKEINPETLLSAIEKALLESQPTPTDTP